MKAAELFGLPGIGKSYILSRRFCKIDNLQFHEAVLAGERNKINKFFNFFFGFYHRPRLIFHLFKNLIIKKSQIINHFSYMKIVFVMYERIGQAIQRESCIVDEGIFQALWGVLYRCRFEEEDLASLISNILNIINIDAELVYVTSCKKTHIHRYNNRIKHDKLDNFEFCIKTNYTHARHITALILLCCRKKKIPITLYFNSSAG